MYKMALFPSAQGNIFVFFVLLYLTKTDSVYSDIKQQWKQQISHLRNLESVLIDSSLKWLVITLLPSTSFDSVNFSTI